jgi:hypothetical protein
MIGTSRRSISANASSHVASTNSSPRRTNGLRKRLGSSCSCFSVEPLGQMKPWLNTSSRSPRMRAISPSRNVISNPHPASHSGQVRYAVRVLVVASIDT